MQIPIRSRGIMRPVRSHDYIPAFPFVHKLTQKLLHIFMSLFRNPFGGGRIHPVFEQEQFFVKMIDGGAVAVLI